MSKVVCKYNKFLYFSVFIMFLFFTCLSCITKPKQSKAVVNIAITTDDGMPIAGANVDLIDSKNKIYHQIATSNTTTFIDIPYGIYTLFVGHSTYSLFLHDSLSIDSPIYDYTVHLRNTNIAQGDTISFGANKWRVLAVHEGRALILSNNIIERLPYHTSFNHITWEHSSIREYLNHNFYYSNIFDDEERSRIYQTTIINENNQWYGTSGGNPTIDKIFLLSISEVVQYFGDSGRLENRPGSSNTLIDEFNNNRIAFFNDDGHPWYLRSPGAGNLNVTYISYEGYINMFGIIASNFGSGIRPALWINL